MTRRAALLWLAALPALAQLPGHERVSALIQRELDEKKIPSIAIAVVDERHVLWAQGFGYADPKQLAPATADTIYRAGSLSGLLTVRGVRQLGIDLDAPVVRYLPEFPYAAVTVRQLMEQRGGLVREPPVGSYYDDTAPTLAATVASLRGVRLAHTPGTETKASDAGLAVLGRILEVRTGQPFAEYMQKRVLDPLGMTRSSYVQTPAVKDALAKGTMWAFDRAPWEAPVFDIGTAPANNLYASANDMARFAMAALREGAAGVYNSSLYGFSATLLLAPEKHAGVAVLASKNGAGSVTSAIAQAAIQADGTAEPWPARVADSVQRPLPIKPEWRELIGEYGPDYNVAYLLERGGRLHLLTAWLHDRELTEVPKSPQEIVVDGVTLRRRDLGGQGAIFRIQPVRPVAELRAEAEKLSPPREAGVFRPQELVDLTKLDPTIKLDIRYATTNNFLSTPSYSSARAFMQRPAAEALSRALRTLHAQGFGLLIHDAYRPWSITKVFWDATPPAQHEFVADPAKGSRHNRGCAVDLTLYDVKTGQAVEMPGVYDEMSARSYPFYPGGTSLQRWHRDVLRRAMEAEGFTVEPTEWWHFNYRDWPFYRIGNESFEELEGKKTHR